MAALRNEVILTAVFGDHAERLDRSFTSFAHHTKAELHALVIGESLPKRRCGNVRYHLVAPDPTFGDAGPGQSGNDAESKFLLSYRNVCYRRWEYIDQLGADYCLVVDGTDVLCLQDLPPVRELLRGAAVAACVEHVSHYYLSGQGYTSNYLNAGVTFWDVAQSKQMRAEILALGRSRLRCLGDDQWAFNEIVQARYYQDLAILPCQFNFRAYLGRPVPGWPSVAKLDGVRIYHCGDCIEKAVALPPVKGTAELVRQPPHPDPPARSLQFQRPYRWVTYGTDGHGGPTVTS
ncbi:MAG TPA: hypothetical protein VEB21_07605 [Terriglobales bacterium]|nr:hypothetical protein [Terriglobales bacterium]